MDWWGDATGIRKAESGLGRLVQTTVDGNTRVWEIGLHSDDLCSPEPSAPVLPWRCVSLS